MEEKKKASKQKINVKEWWSKKRIIVTYGLLGFGTHWYNGFFSGFRTIFFVEVVGMTNIIAGLVDLILKTAKPWFTFLTGVIVEARPFKKGKYYPWLKYGTWFHIGSGTIMFATPFFFKTGTQGAVFVAVLFAVNTLVATILAVVKNIVYANISSNNAERTTAAAASNLLANVSKMVAAIAYPLIFGIFTGIVSEKMAYLPTSIVMGAVTVFCYVFVARDVRKYLNDDEIVVKQGGGRPKGPKFSLKETALLLIKNKALLAMVVAFTLYNTRNMGMGALTTIFFKNILGDIKLLALSRTIGFFATWMITPLIPLLTLKFDMKKAFLGSYLIFTISSFLYAIPAVGLNPTVFIAVNTIGKAIVPILGTLFLAMFAQAIDYGEWKNGTRQSGIQMTFFTLSTNWAMIMAIILRTTLLEMIGYKAGMVFDMAAKLTYIRVYGFSSVLYLISMLAVALFYPINKTMQKQIENDLAVKRAEEGIQ